LLISDRDALGREGRIELGKYVELLPEMARGLAVRKKPLLRLVEMGDDIKLFPGPDYEGKDWRPLQDNGLPTEIKLMNNDDDAKSYISSVDSVASE
jgi:hypothetical protein